MAATAAKRATASMTMTEGDATEAEAISPLKEESGEDEGLQVVEGKTKAAGVF